MNEKLRFPKRFLWGASTSAHQVEGGNHNNWSVWELKNARSLAASSVYKLDHLPSWPMINKLATKPENYVSGRAIDHYNRYEQDFDIVKKMNFNAFRFSIEWSRIEPEEGVWDKNAMEHYRRYIKALKRRGIEPMVTLYHWTVPVWFSEKGAFEKAANVRYFVRFAEKVLKELGGDLRFITTINEPDTAAMKGYWAQDHPPQQHSLLKMLWVYRNHLKAHKKIYSLAHNMSRRFKVGFVKGYACVLPGDERLISRFMAWLDPNIRDSLILSYIGSRNDFLGVNYYFTDRYYGLRLVTGEGFGSVHEKTQNKALIEEVSDMGWGLEPANLELVLKRLGRYDMPIFVMETGLADLSDNHRKDWLNGTIRSVQNALHAGVNVQGYLHWSMFDNFEWAYGRWPRFGLVGIDYENGLARVPRKSAAYYAAVIKKARGL